MFTATHDGKESRPSTSSSIEWSQPCLHFKFPDILLATNNFDDSLVIGHGGFGKVYKGNVIKGSNLVVAAIKRLDSMSTQGATEFWAEIEMLSKLRHCNLVSLIGYCNHGKEMILVYEYMPNGTIEDHLHKLGTPLSWLQRLKICIGAARGLHYLHTGTGIEVGIIHRDVKSSNILLHESWAAKISDFGLSKIGPTIQPSTYVNTLVKGTFGYLDPHYFSTGRLTRKSDVYAFGVVLFEVLCRKRALDESLDLEQWGLVAWAQDSIKEGNLKNIIDCDIRCQISTKCLKEFVRIAERCLLRNPKQRPMMAEVVVSLESVLNLQEKSNGSLQASSRSIIGKMLDMFPSASNEENSAHGDSKLSSNRNVGDTLEVENKDFKTLFPSLRVFKFADLRRATKDFSQDLLLGRGRFGEVFLGWVDKNTFAPSTKGVGISVAVKKYSQGLPEWQASLVIINTLDSKTEIETFIKKLLDLSLRPPLKFIRILRNQTVLSVLGWLAHPNVITLLGYCDDKKHKCLLVYEYIVLGWLAHPNVITLLGYCDDKKHKCLLVYEYMQNRNFGDHLFGDTPDGAKPLSWERRLLIMIGVARALAYMHSSKDQVIHRDVKTSNILLDQDFNAKLGGFGMAKFGSEIAKTGVTTRIIGTLGYLDPGYLSNGHLSVKSDIYSFGVVLLEALTGQQAWQLHRYYSGLVKWAIPFLKDKSELKKIMDPRLGQDYPLEDAFECATLALRCVAKNPKDRPSSEEVLENLKQIYSLNK